MTQGNYPLGKIESIIARSVFSVESLEDQFNLYKDCNTDVDLPSAPKIRRKNLRNYLKSFADVPESLVVAEAPGPWGCRFSGVPITSEEQLCKGMLPFVGQQSSNFKNPKKEYSASIFWRTLAPVASEFFVWNTFPLHPHKPQLPLTIRAPKKTEVEDFLPVLDKIHSVLAPRRVIAVGRTAERALALLKIDAIYVRHPSQGGAKIFADQMETLFRLHPSD